MKSTIFGFVCGLALIAGSGAAPAAAVQDTAIRATDQTLNERIAARVHQDSALKNQDVRVSVESGVVTLTGTVATTQEKTRAAQLAQVNGITRVDNLIVVDRNAAATGTKGTFENTKEAAKDAGASTKEAAKDAGVATKEAAQEVGAATKEVTKEAAEKTKEGAVKVGEKTKETAAKVSEKTLDGLNKAGSEFSDAILLARVKAKFVGEDLLKGSDINVDCDRRVVTLKGTVMSEAGRERALEIARRTDGVTSVIDRLNIGPKH